MLPSFLLAYSAKPDQPATLSPNPPSTAHQSYTLLFITPSFSGPFGDRGSSGTGWPYNIFLL